MAGGRNASGMLEEDGANMCNILSVFQDKVIFDGHTTVSYTHLDVYKRQIVSLI